MGLAANLKWLFTDAPELDRPALARAVGFDGVEVLSPYDQTPEDWAKALAGMPVCLINTPSRGPMLGLAAVAGEEARFRDDFDRALTYARAMEAERVHVMAGKGAGNAARAVFLRNLEWAAERAGARPGGPALTIEPLNAADMPGYFLNDFDQAAAILTELAMPTVGLQFDLWHGARIHGDAADLWARMADLVTHVQIAGLASRAEPCAWAVAFARHIAAAGYQGWIAAEYGPSRDGGWGWMAALRDQTMKMSEARRSGALSNSAISTRPPEAEPFQS